MANEEQLSILKQGVEAWNRWRDGNANIEIDLAMASLKNANLYKANLRESNLRLSDLHGADISGADLREADLREVDLTGADLRRADFSSANLEGANLQGADLREANLRGADLLRADLRGVELGGANFRATNLQESNFSRSVVLMTIFGDLDMSQIIGLEDVIHRGPSTIGTNTIAKSSGEIPEVFLRGCGMSDWEIENVKLYNPNLSNDERNKSLYRIYDLQASQAIQISPLFISYAHADTKFVNKIDKSLTHKGIRFWRDTHDLKAGRLEKQIDQAITQHRIVVLILSEHSLISDWVEHEVRTARELERKTGKDLLCPIALDDSWKDSRWPKRIMEQIMEYNILDFSDWKDDSKFEGMFRKLIDGLELFYKG